MPNATSALLRLTSWQTIGCPVNAYTIRYKPIYQKQWIVLSERLVIEKDFYLITNLVPNREYKLLVSAHSDAGLMLTII